MSWKRWPPTEVAECLRLFRDGWTYRRIADHLGRNVSSVGAVIRREDMREEAAMVAAEDAEEIAYLKENATTRP